jgi:hypothetical protein
MSRRTIFTAALIALVATASLSGCAANTPTSGTTSKPSSTNTAAAPSTPTPTPTPTFVADDYTCQSILPPATLAVFKGKQSAGFTLQKDYVERVHNFDATLALFDDYKGILCQWAYPGATKSVDYGFSAISVTQAKTVQATLTRNGYSPEGKDNGIVYTNADPTDFPDNYLFIDGYWFYASQTSLLDLIVENVFQVADE